MQIATTRFGDIDIDENKILHFTQGVPGWESEKRFILISNEETQPFHWLQSVDNAEVALAVVDPFLLFPHYAPAVPEMVCTELAVDEEKDLLVLTVVVIPQDFENMTTNLGAPVLINARKNLGAQVILENSAYSLRCPIYDLVRSLIAGGMAHAGVDA